MRVGVQLRPWLIQEPRPAFETVLAEAAAAGFDSVEIGAHYLDWEHPEDLRAMLARYGLVLSGVHVGGDIFNPENVKRVRAQMQRVARAASAAGAPFLLYSGLLIEQKTSAERSAELDAIVAAADICAEQGLRLLYHNHWWEISGHFFDLRYYRDHTDPQKVSFCIDLGWVHRAGGDVLQAVSEFRGRAPYFHLRDDTPQKIWMGLGQGAIDFPPLLNELEKLQPDWVVIEQDDITGSIAAAVGSSRRYLRETMDW